MPQMKLSVISFSPHNIPLNTRLKRCFKSPFEEYDMKLLENIHENKVVVV